MRAVLTTDLPVSRVAFFAEMAWLERRPELGALCREALSSGGRLDAEVAERALPGLSKAGFDNLLSWCRMLELCDGGGALTALGERVAETDEAPVPEQGVYGCWVVEHALTGRRILSVQRLGADRGPRFEDVRLLSSPEQGVVFTSVIDPSERFVLRSVPCNHGAPGFLQSETHATCTLTWTLDFEADHDEWRLSGFIESPHGMAAMQHEPEGDQLELASLMVAWGEGPLREHGAWRPERGVLAVALEDTSEREREAFRRDLTLSKVEVPQGGEWADVRLTAVPLGPATAKDAQAWAVSRLVRRVRADDAYRSREQVRELFGELVRETPLMEFGAQLPAHDRFVTEQVRAGDAAMFWHLAAPVDLAPAPVREATLSAMAVS